MAKYTAGVCVCGSGRIAMERCARCVKPVCDVCRVESDGKVFCSENCARTVAAFEAREAQVGKVSSRRLPSIFTSLLTLGVVLVVAWFAYGWFTSGSSPMELLRELGIEF